MGYLEHELVMDRLGVPYVGKRKGKNMMKGTGNLMSVSDMYMDTPYHQVGNGW